MCLASFIVTAFSLKLVLKLEKYLCVCFYAYQFNINFLAPIAKTLKCITDNTETKNINYKNKNKKHIR